MSTTTYLPTSIAALMPLSTAIHMPVSTEMSMTASTAVPLPASSAVPIPASTAVLIQASTAVSMAASTATPMPMLTATTVARRIQSPPFRPTPRCSLRCTRQFRTAWSRLPSLQSLEPLDQARLLLFRALTTRAIKNPLQTESLAQRSTEPPMASPTTPPVKPSAESPIIPRVPA